MLVKFSKRALRSNSYQFFILTKLIIIICIIMHCYPLHAFTPPSLPPTASSLSFSITEKSFIFCWLNSPRSISLDIIDLRSGKRQTFNVKTKKDELETVVLIDGSMIVKTISNLLGEVTLKRIVEEGKDKEFLYLDSMFNQNGRVQMLKAWTIGSKTLVSYLTGGSGVLQEASFKSDFFIKIHPSDLTKNQLVHLVPCQNINNSQKQSAIVLLGIRQPQGKILFGLLDIQWRTFKKTFYPLEQLREDLIKSVPVLCSFEWDIVLLSLSNRIFICQKKRQQWVTLTSFFLDGQIEGMTIKSDEDILKKTLIISTVTFNKRYLYYYDLKALLLSCQWQPFRITADDDLSGTFIGFIKVNPMLPLLLLSNRTYYLGSALLGLTQIIYECRQLHQNQEEHELEESIVFDWNKKEVKGEEISCLEFNKFYDYVNQKEQDVLQHINELFSAKRLELVCNQFANFLLKSFPCLQLDWRFFTQALLRQLGSIALYLSHFINYVIYPGCQYTVQIPSCLKFLLEEVKTIELVDDPLVEQARIMHTIKKSIQTLRDNVLAMGALLQQDSKKEFKCLNSFQFDQIIDCCRDHSVLADKICFLLYVAGKENNGDSWKMLKELLRKLLKVRRDYHPIMAYLCGDMTLFTLNRKHLQYCSYLDQQKEHSLEELPSLGHVDKVSKYLQEMRMPYLSSFVSAKMHRIKFDSEVIMLTVPQGYQRIVESWSQERIKLNQFLYVKVTLTGVAELVDRMESGVIYQLKGDVGEATALNQKMKTISQIFLIELKRILCSEKQKSQQLLKQSQKYDCKHYTNQQYEGRIAYLIKLFEGKSTLVRYNQRTKAIGEASVGLSLQRQMIQHWPGQKYLQGLHSLLQQFDLQFLAPEGRKLSRIEEETPEELFNCNLRDLKQSNIKSRSWQPQEKYSDKSEKQQSSQLLAVVWNNLWELHDNLTLLSSQLGMEVEDCFNQPDSAKFPKEFISILNLIHPNMDHNINFQTKQRDKTDPLKKIRESIGRGEKVRVKRRQGRQSESGFYQESVVKLSLVSKVFSATGEWLLEMDDLVVEAARQHFQMSAHESKLFNSIFDIVII